MSALNIYSPKRELILEALSEEPRLTARQISRLLNGAHSPTNDGTNALLNRMVRDGLLEKLERPHPRVEYFYCLKKKPRWKPLKLSNYEHERATGDAYVSYKTSERMTEWRYKPQEFKAAKLEPDRFMVYDGLPVYLEIDMGTEVLEEISEKVNKYIKVTNEERNKRGDGYHFYVVFATNSGGRADHILSLLAEFKRGNQFLVTVQRLFNDLFHDLSDAIYVSPLDILTKRSLPDFAK